MNDDAAWSPVEVTVPRCFGPLPQTFFVSAAQPAVIPICDNAEFKGNGPGFDYAISVTRVGSTAPNLHVVFKGTEVKGSYDDAFLVIPKPQLGTSYWTMGYRGGSPQQGSRWSAVATAPLTLSYSNCADVATGQGLGANGVFQQICFSTSPPNNKKEEEATGFQISSTNNQPFALISGATCAVVPYPSAPCETLLEMIPPKEWAGNEYLVTEFNKAGNPDFPGDLVRIMALDLDASVTVTEATNPQGRINVDFTGDAYACINYSPAGFNIPAGTFCDLHIEGGARVHSGTGPILVGHFMKSFSQAKTGDASFALVTPTSRFSCGHRFYSFEGYPYDPNPPPPPPTNIGTLNGTYVNIVAPTGAIDTILLDGLALTAAASACLDYARHDYGPGSNYSWAKCRLADPPTGGEQHVIQSLYVGDERITAYAYGQATAAAYSYPTGYSF